MTNPRRLTKVLACLAIALSASLSACGPLPKVPAPNPDHGAPAAAPKQVRVYLSVHGLNNARAERIIVGTAAAIGYDTKPVMIKNSQTGQLEPVITPFKLRSVDGEAYILVDYYPNTALLEVTAILQGKGGDAMLMEITDGADNPMSMRAGGVEYCEITKPVGTMGACTTFANVITAAA